MDKTFSVIVAGSREFNEYDLLSGILDEYLKEKVKAGYKITIISGGARGADHLGERYAKDKGYDLKVFEADWTKYGNSAGMRRNKRMADVANALVAFKYSTLYPNSGTENMIDIAREKRLLVKVVEIEEFMSEQDIIEEKTVVAKRRFKKGDIISWKFRGMLAIGEYDGLDGITAALNYKMDPGIREGDLWHFAAVYTSEWETDWTKVRLAKKEDKQKFFDAMKEFRDIDEKVARDFGYANAKEMYKKERGHYASKEVQEETSND